MHSDVRTSATCVRVSSLRSHSEAVWFETERPLSVEEIREALKAAPGVQSLMIHRTMSTQCHSRVLVTMISMWVVSVRTLSDDNGNTLWLTGDQIRKGAALNAVQIAEYLIKVGDVK